METICKNGEATGYCKPGGYAEYMVAPAAFVGRIPKNADLFELAPILCAGVTTYRGLKRTGARPGQWLAVIGIGGLGHIAVQYARAMGLRVAAIDVADDKLELARALGAEVVVNARKEDGRRRSRRRSAACMPRSSPPCRPGLRTGHRDAAAGRHRLLYRPARRQDG